MTDVVLADSYGSDTQARELSIAPFVVGLLLPAPVPGTVIDLERCRWMRPIKVRVDVGAIREGDLKLPDRPWQSSSDDRLFKTKLEVGIDRRPPLRPQVEHAAEPL